MLRNYLTIAYRNLKRRPGYAAINVTGLAVGMACCLLIVLYVQEELSYDDFHEKADRIVAVGSGVFGRSLMTPYPLAAALEAEVPEVEEALRVEDTRPLHLSRDGKTFYEVEKAVHTEPAFFDIFSFDLLRGTPRRALTEPNSIVLTPTAARRIFSGQDPIGQTLYWRQRDTTLALEVTGLIADPPTNTNVSFEALISFNTQHADDHDPSYWMSFRVRTFALLETPGTARTLPGRLAALADAHYEEDSEAAFFGIPLTALHLSSLTLDEGFTGTRHYVYLFSAIALIILLIACINYVNLATARAAQRAKEVGVRKTAGATRFQLARQFLGESILLTLAALAVAVVLTESTLPVFNGTFGTHLDLAYGENALFLGVLVGMVLLVGLAAGSYPALYLSAFEPTKVLKGRTRHGHSGAWMRKGLVVVQFTLSTVLLIGAFVIHRQLNYVQTTDLGFDEERVVTIELSTEQVWRLRDVLRHDVLRHPGVVSAAVANMAPSNFKIRIGMIPEDLSPRAQAPSAQHIHFAPGFVGSHFIETLGINVVAGRDFSRQYASDEERAYLINEAAAEALGWTPEEAVGKPFKLGSEGEVIGVVENFHLESLREEIDPVVLQLFSPEDGWSRGLLMARLAPGQIRTVMDHIEEQLARYAPGAPFEYQFIGEVFDAMYRTERRLARVFAAVAAVAVLLACLGLFGLAAYAAERRTKEIGIRKVLGASVPSIVALLSKDFLKLVMIAFVIAAPVAYVAMRRWLQDFAYHIEIGPWLFVGAGAAALVIALAAVSYQAIKAALTDPVEALRYE